MVNNMNLVMVILTPMCAVAGFVFRLYVDKFTEHHLTVREKRIKQVEFKLNDFYCPLYTNLRAETIIGNEFVNLKGALVFEIERFVLEAHVDNQRIIKTNMVVANPPDKLRTKLGAYYDHVTLQKLTHDLQQKSTAESVFITFMMASKKMPYDKELVALIDAEIGALRRELDAMLNSIV